MSADSATATAPITVDIWSDVVCPWCYIGKRRFERALETLRGEIAVEVVFRPYQLDPTTPPGVSRPVIETYAKKFGGPERAREIMQHVTGVAAADGIVFHLDRALRANTLLAHRLLWLADQPDSAVSQPVLKERLLRAYFVDGLDVGDPDTLAGCAAEVGFEHDDVLAFLASDRGLAHVLADLELARELGITAVPTFVINGRWAVPGAQDSDTFVTVLRRVRDRMAAGASADTADA